ncbi:18425_t:CDS:2, partial [Gigaspora rosea]
RKQDLDDCVLTNTQKTLITTKVLKLINDTKVGDPSSCYELDMDFKNNRFEPKTPEIKNIINKLLEKEYIERMENSKDMFSFIAH